MLKMSLARVSDYVRGVRHLESILIPVGTCAFCSTYTHTGASPFYTEHVFTPTPTYVDGLREGGL